ncbi:peptidylprolyl isomerase [Myceligenerans pegani]|uniref:Peptidylprolyl isomerase n=1 Tax=Myceligenerans pegani TaxID=2776917 RepID=A0ABR9MZE0_9MICO|nr:peptidylprolyl isomerase [Myceligenerans sp. TRM 65318]MBE1876754.1 peptidylprolyl isomerase [Myceligenerans sp. TRM 65318]MBE3019025.1 peptidylprolyl isomerase [Myceligenerans sp. TRM 65318]
MSTSKQRQRAQQARKQQAKQEQRRAAQRARRRRLTALIAGVAALALVATFVVAALVNTGPAEAVECDPGTTDARADHELPDPGVAEDRTWTVTLHTCATGTEQDITLELDGAAAPQAVASFVTLAGEGYFDGTGCHRLTTSGIYVLQCGDPTFTGTGGPGYEFGPIENAPEDDVYPAGTVAMARQGGNGESMGSQFFLVYEDSQIPSDEAGGYTVFGEITSGLDVVRAVADEGVADGATDGEPAGPVTIEGVETQ